MLLPRAVIAFTKRTPGSFAIGLLQLCYVVYGALRTAATSGEASAFAEIFRRARNAPKRADERYGEVFEVPPLLHGPGR